MLKTSNKEALAYIIGVAIGDGNLSNPNGRAVRLRITCDIKYPNIIQEIISNLKILAPNNKISKINRKNNCIDISCYSNDWEKILNWKADNGPKTKQGTPIPLWIKQNKKYIKKFLKGLFQTDGCIYYDRGYEMVNFVTIMPKLAEEVSNLIKKLGFESKKYIIKNKITIRITKNTNMFINTIDLKKETAKPKILVILGPTATGKSDLAVKIAQKFNGEIISADSRQVYKGMNIGSGKITKKEMHGVPHHLLDVVSPKKIFSVTDFQKLAYQKIDEILARKKLPILCGGTGFYIESIVSGFELPPVKRDFITYKKLEKMTTIDLQKKLKKLDPKRFDEIDKNNRVRLIRAIEIASALEKNPKIKKMSKYNCLQIGIKLDQKKLDERILARLLKRIEAGMIDEVRALRKKGVSWKRLESFGLEYRYVALFLQGKIEKEEMIKTLQTRIRQFSKRQMTWFKRDKKIEWFNPKEVSKIINKVGKFY